MKRLFILLIVLMLFSLNFADEGMWTYDNPPLKQLKENYNFVPSQEWLDHLRLSSVRFMDGGSGSFVSPEGLILTNHHVAVGQLQKMSTAEVNYVQTGFLAKTREDEIKCPDLEINVLQSMENVTDQILSVVTSGMSTEDAYKAKRAKMAEIEKEEKEKTGLECEIVNLYHGGEYWVYRYKKYTDVRLVCAPERQAAYFGGDYDNFTYPRYDLDFAFFRAYENGKPIHTENYLQWFPEGASEDDLVFVSGHPGSTDRLYTYSQLLFQRDYRYPEVLKLINHKLDLYKEYAQKGPEQQRRALISQFGLSNALKAMTGEYQGLQDTSIMNQKKREEEQLLRKIKSNPELSEKYSSAWDEINRVVELQQQHYKELFYRNLGFSRLARIAQTIVRYVEEVEKPDAERLDGYHEAELDRLKFRLFSPAPIYKDMEELNLEDLFVTVKKELGSKDKFVKALLGHKDPVRYARDIIEKTRLDDVAYRKELIEGGKKAVKKSKDPLIKLSRSVDKILREQDKWEKENIRSKLISASEKVAAARFGIYGKSTYPDATFTLRLAYGKVKGYPMNGTIAPCFTTLYGLYDRALSFKGMQDYMLPQRFWDRQDQLELATPVNFVSTCDIIGGNSGSPVVDREGKIVGLIFDGNIESLTGRFVYDESKNRAVAVHIAYITEALNKLYDAQFLVKELEGE